MLGLILITGLMLSTAGLLSAPRMRRPRPYREDDTGASLRADVLHQKDTLYTAVGGEGTTQAGKTQRRGEDDAVNRPKNDH